MTANDYPTTAQLLLNGLIIFYKIYCYLFFRYYSVIPDMRQNMTDPFCELFPKMAACHYHRYGMGGREDDRHAICILGTVLYILDSTLFGAQ